MIDSHGKTEQACISYRHIDAAIEQAKFKLRFKDLLKKKDLDAIHSSLEPPVEAVAAIGELNMAATQIIAEMFDLSNDELLNGLPLIDMSKTKFSQICPKLVKQDLNCQVTRFRTFTGHCNNLMHPTWGAAMTPFARYLPPVHPDGIQAPRKSVVPAVHSSRDPHLSMYDKVPRHNAIGEIDDDSPTDESASSSFMNTRFRRLANASWLQNGKTPSARRDDNVAASSVQFLSHSSLNDPTSDSAHMIGSPPMHDLRLPSPVMPMADHELALDHKPMHEGVAFPGRVRSIHDSMGHHASPSLIVPTNHANSPMIPSASAVVNSDRIAGSELPTPRLVASVIHRDIDLPNHDFTILFMSWGQLLDHDMSRASQPPSTLKCCNPENSKNKLCLPINVPVDDPLYAKFNIKCLDFRRSLAGIRPNCVLGPRVHQNAITSPIDANFVYGSSQADADSLRMFSGGRLRDRDWFRQEGLKPLLPAQELDPDQDCIARPKDLFCFRAGDVRANEQIHLTVLHTLYMRQHNRMADRLADLNPHWDDERIYQETRHIIAATVQHIMLNEYLPLLIGPKMVELYNLTAINLMNDQYDRGMENYWHGYDAGITTSVSNSFAAAAFRQGHTFIQSTVERYNKYHEFVASEKLHRLLKQPFIIYTPGILDELTGGLINQPSQSFDPFITEEVSGRLFQLPDSKIGHDLASINIQRGREQGLPGYNIFREWCGLPRAETFSQLEPYLTNRTAYQYSKLFQHVDDIDVWSGGISERKLPGAAVGPTFACLIARQFSNTRRGDRFWYENPGLPSSFTPKQLAEIRKIKLAKIICENSDDIPTIQQWAFKMPHPVMNERVPCRSLPDIDLTHWVKDHSS